MGKVIKAASLGANTGRPDDPGRMYPHQAAVMHLNSVRSGKGSQTAKVTALRHLSFVGTTDDAGKIAPLIQDAQLREEVASCLERIPGKASEEALLAAPTFRCGRPQAAHPGRHGHRQVDEAAGAAIAAMGSSDTTIAMAGLKAWARIGTSGGMDVTFSERDSLSEWQNIEFDDSQLRYADAQLARGTADEAQAIHMEALERDEEHLQCAAAAIFPKLDSADNSVRTTARQKRGLGWLGATIRSLPYADAGQARAALVQQVGASPLRSGCSPDLDELCQ